jgi:hypothetical protein
MLPIIFGCRHLGSFSLLARAYGFRMSKQATDGAKVAAANKQAKTIKATPQVFAQVCFRIQCIFQATMEQMAFQEPFQKKEAIDKTVLISRVRYLLCLSLIRLSFCFHSFSPTNEFFICIWCFHL